MQNAAALARLERFLQKLALVIGLLVAVVIPVAYGTVRYLDHLTLSEFQAGLAADRLGQFAYVYGKMWRFNSHRVPELIAFAAGSDPHVHQAVLDAKGTEVASIGPPQTWPCYSVQKPIISSGERVGTVILTATLAPLLPEIAICAVFGAGLAVAIFCSVHFFPLRALRRAMASLKQTQGELRDQVARTEMALEVSQAQRNRAEIANRTKSEFLANMSHELRTPLNAIIGFSDVLRGQLFGGLSDRYRDYAEDIHASGTHLLQIINDILDVAKIEAGQLKIHPEPVRVDGLVESCLRLVRVRAAEAGIKLIDHTNERTGLALLDVVKARQILLNLLANAVKFTPRGGMVTISARAAGPGWLEIDVADTGIGMCEEEIELALQPFRQADNSHTRRYAGTGLGLPLAKALAEAHGGALWIRSVPTRGTIVTVRLPADMQQIECGVAA
jgi:signal transduction histidine kinase